MRKSVGRGQRAGRVLSASIAALLAVVGLVIAAPTSTSAATGPGTPDTSFMANTGSGFNSPVLALGHLSDDTIIAGGQFTEFDGNTANYLAALNPDGTFDADFTSNLGTGFDGVVKAVAVQPNGQIVVGGYFTHLNHVPVSCLARLNADGTPDTTFNSNLGTGVTTTLAGVTPYVNSIAIQDSGAIVLGGYFDRFNGISAGNLARVSANGTPDGTFLTNTGTGLNASVTGVGLLSDDSIIVTGEFTTVDGTTSKGVARFGPSGSPNLVFAGNIGTGTTGGGAVAVQPGDQILVAGFFPSGFDGTLAYGVVRLSASGVLDTGFTTNTASLYASGAMGNALSVQPNGQIVFVGLFYSAQYQSGSVTRLRADGAPDYSFMQAVGAGSNGIARSVTILSTGLVVIGGQFSQFSGTTVGGIAALAGKSGPRVSTVSPGTGPIAGGTAVTLSGSGFSSNAEVTVGGAACTGTTVVNSTRITCTTPAGSAGPATVSVTNNDHQTGSLNGGFTYVGSQVPAAVPASPTAASPCVFLGKSRLPWVGHRALVGSGCRTSAKTVIGAKFKVTKGSKRSLSLACDRSGTLGRTKSAGGGYRYCSDGELVLKTSGHKVKLTVSWYGKAGRGYASYTRTKSYST